MKNSASFKQPQYHHSFELNGEDGGSLLNAGSLEDRLDSDIEADIQQTSLCSEVTISDGERLSMSSVEAFGSGDPSIYSSFSPTGDVKQSTFFSRAFLSGVSSQLHSFSSKADVGSPTCLSILRYLVIGTTKGIIFVFNVHQVLLFCFGAEKLSHGKNTRFGESLGSVSALCQNATGSHLMSGYTSGRIAVWRLHSVKSVPCAQEHLVQGKLSEPDSYEKSSAIVDGGAATNQKTVGASMSQRPVTTTNTSTDRISGQLLFIVDDAHGAGQAIAMCSFTTISSLSVCVDTGGSAFQVHFKRGLATGVKKESACFFSGSRGEICGLEALSFSSAHTDHAADCSPSRASTERNKFLGGPLGAAALVAMASFTKLIIVKLRPRIQIVYWRPFKGPSDCLPLLAWQWDYRTCSCRSSSFALLAFGRGSSLHVLKVSGEVAEESVLLVAGVAGDVLRFELLHSVELMYSLISLKWLPTENQLVTLDVSETLHLVESSSGDDIESIDVSPLHLVYHKELFRSAAAGGSVSEALEAAGQRSCTYSVAAYDSQLLLLGETGVHLFTSRTWLQIIKSLLAHGNVDVALVHCVNALRIAKRQLGSTPTEVSPFQLPPIPVGHIPVNRMSRQKLDSEVLSLLRQYILPLLATEGQDVWKVTAEGVETVLDIASLLGACEFVTSELFPLLRPVVEWRSWCFVAFFKLIQTLRPFGLLSDINTISGAESDRSYKDMCYNLRPDITRELLDWCLDPEFDTYRFPAEQCTLTDQSVGHSWAEICILKLAPTTLDLDQCIKLCWSHRLYSSYLHLCTDILMDFETPFKTLHNQLTLEAHREVQESGNSAQVPCSTDVECCHHLLILVRLALAAESSSHNPLPSPMNDTVPKQIFDLLLKSYPSLQHGVAAHRPLTLLLRHVSVDFLNLLTLSASSDAFFREEPLGPSRRYRLYRELIACSLEFDSSPLIIPGNTPYPIQVFTFIVHQLTSEADPKKTLDLTLLLKLYSLICSEFKDFLQHNSLPFESAVTDLIARNCFTDLDTCLFLSQRAQCYHVCEYIHRLRNERFEAFRDQLAALQCSLPPCFDSVLNPTCAVARTDAEPHPVGAQIFSFLELLFPLREPKEETLRTLHLSHEDLVNIKILCLEKLSVLVRYDAERTLRLLVHVFGVSISDLLSQLSTSFTRYKAGTLSSATEDQSGKLSCLLLLRTFFQCRHYLVSQSGFSNTGLFSADIEYKYWESFLLTMCPEVAGFFVYLLVESGAPESELLQFLNINRDYDALSLVQIVSYEAYPHALAYLYERLGELDKALEIHEQSFVRNWKLFVHQYDASSVGHVELSLEQLPNESLQQYRIGLHSVADNWFTFCQRYQSMQNGGDAKNIWFHVIDVLMEEQSLVSASFLISELNELFHHLLSLVTIELSLTAIVSYILQNQSSDNSAKFANKTNAFVTQLLTTCHFETEQTALNKMLVRRDLTMQQLGFLSRFRKGCNVKHAWCDLCAHRLRYDVSSNRSCCESAGCARNYVLLFRCSHVFHLTCVDTDRRALIANTQQPDQHLKLICPLCPANQDKSSISLPLLGPNHQCANRCRPLINHSNDPIRVELVGRDTIPPNPFDE